MLHSCLLLIQTVATAACCPAEPVHKTERDGERRDARGQAKRQLPNVAKTRFGRSARSRRTRNLI
jgi:hypothetical protein